jgi:hypothetical protein
MGQIDSPYCRRDIGNNTEMAGTPPNRTKDPQQTAQSYRLSLEYLLDDPHLESQQIQTPQIYHCNSRFAVGP